VDWHAAESIFQEVLASPADEREAILVKRCGDDTALRALVERLLAHDDRGMGSFLAPLGPPAASGDAAQPPLPARVGHYAIGAKIGEGGMGAVYEAEDTKLRRRIALKVLPRDLSGDADRLLRFEREARAVARLNHPNIVTLHSVEHAGGLHFLTMELVTGGTLADVIPAGGLPVDRILDLGLSLADAMIYAHDHGIVHRDLKPGNVVLDDGGRPKILDFSLAKILRDRSGEDQAARDAITAKGFVFGTVSYMAPEQIKGEAVDHRADLYSLGAMLFEMSTGRRPFAGESIADIASAVLRDPVPSPTALRADLPVALDRIVRRCLEKDPERRYPSAEALRDDLAALRQQMETGKMATRAQRRRRRRGGIALAAASLLAVAVVGYQMRHDEGPVGPGTAATESEPDTRPRLVVLPFDNLGAPDDAYIAAGITQEVMSRLAEVGALSVVSRTSALRYARSEKTVAQIGADLDVSYILEGTVLIERLSDGTDSVRVTPQLIDVARDAHLWSERYAASLAPGAVFRVQSRIAERVAAAMDLTLAAAERRAIQAAPTADAQAWDNYLLGSFQWHKRTTRSVALAASYFEKAVAADPEFAEAHAGLADAYALFPLYGVAELSRAEAYDRAESAARRAIALDEGLAAAHTALAVTRFYGRWDFAGAESHFRRAVASDPDYAVAHYWYGELLAATGRLDDAVAQARRAVSADPSLAVAHHLLGVWLIAAGGAEEGEAQLELAIELEPGFPFARVELADFYFSQGRWDDAFAQWQRSGIPRDLTVLVAQASNDPELTDSASKAVAAFESAPEVPGHFGSLGAASFYALAGDSDAAMRRLESSFREHSEAVTFLPTMVLTDPGIRILSEDPRFQDLLHRAGLD